MNKEEICSRVEMILPLFQFAGDVHLYMPYGKGHINDSYYVETETENNTVQGYMLQRINHEVFRDPDKLMQNIEKVTEFLKKKILEYGGDPSRETLQIVKTRDGKNYCRDSKGNYWRSYLFISEAICYSEVRDAKDFYESAVAFGRFQKLLAEFPASELYETIPDFHNTPIRYQAFLKVVEENKAGRVRFAGKEISFIKERESVMNSLTNLYEKGMLPLRVTHNDTKLNNVMMDEATGKGLCVIDLDTVMPGLAVNDFGDSIRFGASTGAEDEKDLSKVSLDLDLFSCYTKGFLEGSGGMFTDQEIKCLATGAKMMTLECGMRFLTDYLQGDIYFKVQREQHNLDRTRTQLKLVEDMEEKWSQMEQIVERERQ